MPHSLSCKGPAPWAPLLHMWHKKAWIWHSPGIAPPIPNGAELKFLLCTYNPLVWSVTTLTRDLWFFLFTQTSCRSPLFQADLLFYLLWVASLCTPCPAHCRPHQSTGFVTHQERREAGSNYNGMGGRGIVRGRTDAERQEKTRSLIQLINIINVIIFLLWFKHSMQKSCLLVRVSDKSLQIQKARWCTAVTVFL